MAGAPSVVDVTRGVLLAVRLRPLAPAAALEAVLASIPVEVDDVERFLGRLELAGLVERGRVAGTGWRLTDDGRHEGERLLAEQLDQLGVRNAVTADYERFVALNGPLIRACTDWQLRDAASTPPVVNDHTDPVFDREVIDRLGTIHDAVVPVCDDLAAHLGRFSAYVPRLAGAMDRIRAGDLDAVDQPDTDSYHAIWFELHDHLLATLGRDRSREPLP